MKRIIVVIDNTKDHDTANAGNAAGIYAGSEPIKEAKQSIMRRC